jgi:hypothetical protein
MLEASSVKHPKSLDLCETASSARCQAQGPLLPLSEYRFPKKFRWVGRATQVLIGFFLENQALGINGRHRVGQHL